MLFDFFTAQLNSKTSIVQKKKKNKQTNNSNKDDGWQNDKGNQNVE